MKLNHLSILVLIPLLASCASPRLPGISTAMRAAVERQEVAGIVTVVATRAVAAEKKGALADVSAAFHAQGTDEVKRAALFAWDKIHLGEAGHRLAAETVIRAIEKGK